MPDLQPLTADEPYVQFNVSATTDGKQHVFFLIPQINSSLSLTVGF
jgi:hypothetical protein